MVPDPNWSFPTGRARETILPVQLIASTRTVRPPLGAVLLSVLVGLVLLVGGLFLAYVTFATPMISRLTPASIRPSAGQMALGAVVWGIALVAPPAFALVGAWRISRVVRALSARPRARVTSRAASELGDDYVAASEVCLPDGRIIHDLVLGPFGVAVFGDMPPARYIRRTSSSWEIRGHDGWVNMENPLERTARDAERIRRWFAGIERDYTLKVFAALVTTDPTVTRTPTCAVVAPEQVAAWLSSLPPARQLSADRRAEIAERLAGLV
jgi:hypothetical protein